MKFSITVMTCFFSACSLAVPMIPHHFIHKRAVVTEVVQEYKVYYQKQVVYVDENGNKVSTSLEIVNVSTLPSKPTNTAGNGRTVSVTTPVTSSSTSTTSAKAQVTTSAQAAVTPITTTSPKTITTIIGEVLVSPEEDDNDEEDEAQEATSTSESDDKSQETTDAGSDDNTTSTSTTEVETSSTSEATTTSTPTSTTIVSTSVQETVVPTTSTPTTIETSTTTSTTAPTSTSTSPGEGTYSGDGTYYDTGLGACGITSNNSEFVVALSHELYDSVNVGGNPNNNPYCGRKINVYRGDKSVQVTVVDRCPGCSYYSLDLSPAAFNVLGTEAEGRIPITWSWN